MVVIPIRLLAVFLTHLCFRLLQKILLQQLFSPLGKQYRTQNPSMQKSRLNMAAALDRVQKNTTHESV